MKALSDDQKQAINKLEKLRVGALFMDPGTGKTRVAINLVESSQTDYVLFLVPFQTKNNLLDEIKKWHLSKKYRIEGVESLSNSDRLYLELLDDLKKHQKPFIVVDESLKIKNLYAKRTQRVLELGKHSYYRLVLNGTPLSKNIMDLYPQMLFLSSKILKMDRYEFMNKFVEYVVFHDNGVDHTYIKDFTNMEYLYSLIRPYVVDANLNLGVKSQDIDVDYFLSIEKDYEYQGIKRKYIDSLYDLRNNPNIFMAMLTELQQSYCDTPNKIATALKLVEQLGEQDTIIFCKFLKSKDILLQANKNLNILTYGKGSLGLNLQRFKHIIFYDKTFDYAQLIQAKRRIYRMGQDSNVTFHYLTGDVGLEKMIDRNIEHKTSMLDSFREAIVKGNEVKMLDAI